MKLLRRRFLHLTAGAVAIATLTPSIVRAQAQVLKPRSARDRLEEALARIADPKGEGSRACLTVYTQVARDAADAADARARAGVTLGPLDGVIVSIKDLFDVAGEPTRAGSKVLADAPPASADAPVLRRLRAAGGVIVAKTNMSEFAFNITGLNPHYGTPGNPADRTRIPGGSSSGGAVAVADGMCEIAIGTDSGGSVRAPAALCSIVGFKPSQRRIPIDGAFPLSYTLDSIGPMARTVDDCAAADAVIAGEEFRPIEPVTLAGLRLGISRDRLLEGLDEVVSARFSAATTALSKADVRLADKLLPLLDDMVSANRGGGILPVEAYAIHRDRLASKGQDYDPYVRSRLEQVRDVSASDYMNLIRERARLVRAMDGLLGDIDALVLPTTPIVAPTIAEVSSSFEAMSANGRLVGRNTGFVNFFDLCAISLPLPRSGGLPVGLTLVARNGHDRKLLGVAAAVERLFMS